MSNLPHYFENIKSSRIVRLQTVSDDQHLLIKVTIHACELIHFATIFTHPDICVTGQDAEFNPTLEHLSKNKEKLLSEAVINPESDIIVYLEVDQGNHLSELRKCIYNSNIKEKVVNPSVDCVRDTDNVGPSCKFLQYGEPQLYINSDPGDYTIILTGTYTLNSAINLGKIGTVREIKSQQERKQLIINGDFIDELNTGKVIFNNINFNYLGSSLSVISQGGDNSNIEIIDCTVTNSQTNFRLISKQGNGQLNIEVFEFQEKTIQTRVVSIEHNATINDCLFQNIINTDDFEYPNYNDLIYIVVNQESDEVLISNCLFSNIQYDIGQGGVYRIVASNQAQVLIINSEFYQCQTDLGSTIYTSINSGSSVKIDGKCQFIQCGITTLQGGGSILADLDGENCLLIIGDGIKFDSCYSHQNNGGCIYASIRNGASLIFEGDCLFQNCSCYQISGGLRAWCITSGKLIKVAGLIEFDNCSSIEGSGGAAFFGLYDESTLEINKIICKDCKAIQGGGVNMQLGVSPHLIIKNQADFIRCESSRFAGGGLYIDCQEQDCDIQFLGVMNFIDCSASRGGGLVITSFASNQIIMSNQCKFLNCSSFDGDGGGILLNFYRHPFQVQITGNIVFEDCSCSGNGGGMYIYSNQQGQIQITGEMKFIDCIGSQGGGLSIYSFQIISVISSSIIFQNCTGTSGGGMYMFLSNIETEIQITGEISFDNCSSSYQGGGLYLEISKSQLSFENKLEFVNCKSRNGGAMYLSINFELQSSIEIKDIIIQECQALISTDYQYSQSGFGGGIFIAGTGVYDVSSKMLDFSKMKMYDNSADKAGQSLYVAMPNVIEWCRKGISGEYVKGNYSDIDSDESELEGIPVEYSNFNSLSQVNIIKDQRPLELWWRTIWHILNRNEGTIKGNNQPGCAEYSNPCYSINYALQQISFELGGILTSVIPEKRIGICEEGYDLTSPIQFNKSNTYTNIIKIMKQLYMTKYNMEGKAEIKIIKGGDTSNIENGHKGWILASGGIELKFYFIKFITDKSKLNIPIIYIEDQNTNLELDSVTFSDINLSPSDDPKGIIHVDVDNTELIISDCIFEDITIQGEGGSAIRIENDQENSFDATIEATQFNNINSTGEESGQGGSAIYAEIREDCSLIIDDSCEFNDCVIESGNGGAIYVDIDYSKNFQFKIKDASFRHNKALKHNSVEIPPSGYGGVIFLTGTGDYDVESDQIDLSGMKSDSNSADNGGNNVYIVMPQLEEFCQYDEGSLVKGDYDDKLSNLSDVEGIATNISTFIQFTPEQISQEQKSLQYYWTIIASLRTAKVVVDFRNVDEPFKYQLVGKNMKQGNLNAKIIEIDQTTDPINIVDQQDEQLATFAMKDKQFLNYKQKQYGALISNDRRFFTGSDGIEGRTVLLEVEVVFDTEEKLTDPPQKSKFAWWIGLLIVIKLQMMYQKEY
ncbi:MAG: hypothetical protein EZS28_001877 [Streblomastix strix]|uniref:Uncharacterized protein n=1 Tax=Streblomastix strix TaxID=222440 RepID=A0A5J4X5Z2_9EUKA|nr:MAG: hypothetical protein EZS28_001877 [Streblomastix strix]